MNWILMLIVLVVSELRLAWRDYGGLVPLVGIGMPALMWAAVYGVPA